MICFKFRTLYLHYSSDFETCQYFLCNFPNFFRGDFMYENYCKIRDLRKLKDSDVSKGANVSKSTFSDWKSGRSLPGTDKVLRIAKFLEVTVEELLGSENYEYDSKAHTWDYALNISKKEQIIFEKVMSDSDLSKRLIAYAEKLAEILDEEEIEINKKKGD